jgi:hypothetical protein
MPLPIRLILSGGLGNQLFQISAGIFIKDQLKFDVNYDASNLLGRIKSDPGNYTRHLEISELLEDPNLVTKKPHWFVDQLLTRYKRTFRKPFYVFENSPFDRPLQMVNQNTRGVYGFFQDANIVNLTWDSLLLRMKKSEKFSPLVSAGKLDRIAIHIRFGDYSDDPGTKRIYGLTKQSYYFAALENLAKQNASVDSLVIVTDNAAKAETYLSGINFPGQIQYISNSTAIEDLMEIARSAYVITSNSTFSWWGGWVAHRLHGSKIIYPRPWLADKTNPDLPIYVDEWQAIERDFDTQ